LGLGAWENEKKMLKKSEKKLIFNCGQGRKGKKGKIKQNIVHRTVGGLGTKAIATATATVFGFPGCAILSDCRAWLLPWLSPSEAPTISHGSCLLPKIACPPPAHGAPVLCWGCAGGVGEKEGAGGETWNPCLLPVMINHPTPSEANESVPTPPRTPQFSLGQNQSTY
jgi:hypothetical protein